MALFTLPDSAPAMHAESQLFSVPVSFTERWKTEHERINPTTVLNEEGHSGTSGDINFYIPPSSSGLLSLRDVCLEMEVAIKVKLSTETEWRFIGVEDGVAPSNNFMHSLLQSVHVTVCNKLISDCSNSYPYRAYFQSLLEYSCATQLMLLRNAGHYVDTAYQFNNYNENDGEKGRRTLFSHQNFAQLSGKIFADIFETEKPLITGVPINIRLVINRPEFYLRIFDVNKLKQFKVVIRNTRICLRRFIPAPDYMIKVTEELQSKTCKYHLERRVMRVLDISRGVQSTVVSNLVIGQLPKLLLLGFVSSEDYYGKSPSSPFNFQHFDLTQLSVECDGQSYPSKPFTADYGKKQSLEPYNGLLEALGRKNHLMGELNFTREAYAGGFCIYGVDLTPGSTGLGPLTLVRQGNLSVSVTFAHPLKETIMMVAMLGK